MKINKNDIVIIAIFLGIALFVGIAYNLILKKPGDIAEIKVNGQIYGEYALNQDRTIEIETEYGKNVVVISNGEVDVLEANCNDKICVEHKNISKCGETIVCLPNKVSITISGTGEIDGITR